MYLLDSSSIEGQQREHLGLAGTYVSQTRVLSGAETPVGPLVSGWDICQWNPDCRGGGAGSQTTVTLT